jgi:uncharacterized metal-binding protein
MERRLLLDVVVSQRAPVLELLASENQTLLIRRNAFLVLDLGLHLLDRVAYKKKKKKKKKKRKKKNNTQKKKKKNIIGL